MDVTVVRVHTHTHTQGNLINKKVSIENALFEIYKTDQLV